MPFPTNSADLLHPNSPFHKHCSLFSRLILPVHTFSLVNSLLPSTSHGLLLSHARPPLPSVPPPVPAVPPPPLSPLPILSLSHHLHVTRLSMYFFRSGPPLPLIFHAPPLPADAILTITNIIIDYECHPQCFYKCTPQ